MNKEEVLKLAELARIRLSPAEAEKLSHEFEAILKYVGEVKDVAPSAEGELAKREEVYNVFRADGEGHEPGLYTERLLAASPEREGNYFKVKKIL